MAYKNFKIYLIIRTLMLTASIFFLSYLVLNTDLYFTFALIGILIAYQVYSLITYLEQTNRILKNFLESIRYSDFSRTFEVKGMGETFDTLIDSFNLVIKDFNKIRAEKERHFSYLQSVLQHIEIGMIAFQRNGKVEWINNASKRLFDIKGLDNINNLKSFSPELVNILLKMNKDDKALVKVVHNNNIMQLSISGTIFTVEQRQVLLVSIKNIQYELEENEIESWQKLIRVLTHEIMNSITPISSLSTTINTVLKEFSCDKYDKLSEDELETLKDVTMALETIHKRSDGLIHFVDTYRNLTKIPNPDFKIFPVSKLFSNIEQLFKKEIQEKGIIFSTNIKPENFTLSADEQLIEQVIINLVTNSIHALNGIETPQIILEAEIKSNGRKTITVSDNGPGILKDVLDKIFIPFFTTKPKGSGIGLSLSKQILRLHGGTISAFSEPNKQTSFTLYF